MPPITCAASRTAEELTAIQRWSDYAAEIQAEYPGMVYGFATMLPCGGPAFIKETERAIRELGLKGILIHSNHKGHYPDDDEARPFWELVQDLDVPVFIHPPHIGFGEERMREYRLASSIGRPARPLPRAVAHHRARHSGGLPAGDARHLAWRRRHLRGDRPHGLCL